MNSGVKTKKNRYREICEKTVLAHKFWGADQYFGGLRSQNALQWQRPSYSFWGTILLKGAQFLFEGTSSDLAGARPRNAPTP